MEPKKAHKPWSWKEWEAYHRRASLPNWHASGVGFTVCVCGCLLETCHKHISVSFEDIKYPQWKAMKSEQSTHCANKVVRHAVEASPFWKRPSWRDPWWLSRLSLTESDRSLPVLERQLASKGGVPAGLRCVLEHVGASTRIDPVLRH